MDVAQLNEGRSHSGDETESLSYSEAGTDRLDDFLRHYTFSFSPTYCLKLRKSAKGAVVGLNWTLTGPQPGFALKLKPHQAGLQRWIRKAVISQSDNDIRIYSARIDIWKYLKVQVVGHHDLDTHRTTISWKLKTKWAVDQHSIFTKQKFAINELLTLRTHSKIQHNMPELEGRVAVSRQQRDVDASFERGYCHITIPKVEAIVNLDNGRRWASRWRDRNGLNAAGSQAEGSGEGGQPESSSQDSADTLFGSRRHSTAAAQGSEGASPAEQSYASSRHRAPTSSADPSGLFGPGSDSSGDAVCCPRCGHSFYRSAAKRSTLKGAGHDNNADESRQGPRHAAEMPRQLEGFRVWLSRFRGPAAEQRA